MVTRARRRAHRQCRTQRSLSVSARADGCLLQCVEQDCKNVRQQQKLTKQGSDVEETGIDPMLFPWREVPEAASKSNAHCHLKLVTQW